MTERLYYSNSYNIRFEAAIVERLLHGDQSALVLDRTLFYPTSGGQPHDTGLINDTPLVDVFVRRSDQAIVHVLAGEVWSDTVTGQVQWDRRFDHMQQHTGQHILSQSFIRVAGADTSSFHLGEQSSTIDINSTGLSAEQVEEAELLANATIWENHPIWVYFASAQEAAASLVRGLPPLGNAPMRLIDIDGFDRTACGGTHVDRTGEVGSIKILRLERRGEQLRVEFRCGRRALLDFRRKNTIVNRLMAELTTGADDILNAVARLREEARHMKRLIKKQESELLKTEAERLMQSAAPWEKARIVTYVFTGRDISQVRELASRLASQSCVVALLGIAGASAHLIFARAADAPGDMSQLLTSAMPILGAASGGGSAAFAQGGGPAGDHKRVLQAVTRAEKLLRSGSRR